MTVTAPPRHRNPADRDDFDVIVEALVEEARQRARRRRRRNGAIIAFAVFVGLVVATIAARAEGSQTGAADRASNGSPAAAGRDSQIAFSVAASGSGGYEYELYVVHPDGTGLRRVARFTSSFGPHIPSWSHDGQELAFMSMPSGNEDVFVVGARGTAKRNLTRNSLGEYNPVWSPDGRRIAWERFTYFSHVNPGNAVWVMNADGSAKRLLGPGGHPLWSPDGRLIAYTSFPQDDAAAIMNADGSGQHTLTLKAIPQAWSPDGRQLLLGKPVGWDPVDRVPASADIYVADADGSGVRRIMRNAFRGTWSPDGEMIAFEYYRGQPGIYVMNADGSDVRKLTNDGRNPVWSPDGQTVAFEASRDAYPQIYLIDRAGGDEWQLTDIRVSSELSFSWSPAQTN